MCKIYYYYAVFFFGLKNQSFELFNVNRVFFICLFSYFKFKQTPFTFIKIFLGYYLCADTEEEMKSWIDCVKRSISGSSKQMREMTADDFTLLHTIGKGSFGKVLQVKKKDNGQIYAMKILNKKNIIDNNEVCVFFFFLNYFFFFSFLIFSQFFFFFR